MPQLRALSHLSTHNSVISSNSKHHLQALRHIRVLAVEPRCLIARGVDTKAVVYLPVKVQVREKDSMQSTQLVSPTLLPDLNRMMAIKVDTPRYWPFISDILKFLPHGELIIRNQPLWV